MINKIEMAGQLRLFIMALCTSLAILSAPAFSYGQTLPSENAPMSTQLTLDFAFARFAQGVPWDFYRRSNPSAHDALVKIVQDKSLVAFHPATWRMLGFIGNAEDVKLIKHQLDGFRNVLSDDEQAELRSILESLGLLAARNVDGAETMWKSLLTVSFWKSVPFQWAPDSSKSPVPQEYMMLCVAFEGYALSGKNDGMNAVSAEIAKSSSEDLRKYLEWRLDTQRLQKLKISADQYKSKPEIWALAQGKSNGDLADPKPSQGNAVATSLPSASVPVADKEQLEQLRRTAKDAQAEFEKIRSKILENNFDAIATNLLDSGRIISPLRLEKSWQELKKDLLIERQLLESPAAIKAPAVDIKIEKWQLFTFADPAAEANTAKEEITVSFTLKGTSDLGKSPLFRSQIGRGTIADDGSLIVLMKRIDGKWYWNPFGW